MIDLPPKPLLGIGFVLDGLSTKRTKAHERLVLRRGQKNHRAVLIRTVIELMGSQHGSLPRPLAGLVIVLLGSALDKAALMLGVLRRATINTRSLIGPLAVRDLWAIHGFLAGVTVVAMQSRLHDAPSIFFSRRCNMLDSAAVRQMVS